MNALQLKALAHKLNIEQVNVVARDEYLYDRPGKFIVNNHCTGFPGEHWLAILNHNRSTPEFFDSMGRSPKHYGFENQFVYSCKRLQDPKSSLCWAYCLYFLSKRCDGMSYQCILHSFNEETLSKNDDVVKYYLR